MGYLIQGETYGNDHVFGDALDEQMPSGTGDTDRACYSTLGNGHSVELWSRGIVA